MGGGTSVKARTPLEQQQISAFETAISGIKQAAPAPLPRAYIWKEQDPSKIPATYVFKRGNPATPAVAAQPASRTFWIGFR